MKSGHRGWFSISLWASMLAIFKTSLIGRMGMDGSVPAPFGKLSCSWPPVWLVPFWAGQRDARSLVLVYEMQPGKMRGP